MSKSGKTRLFDIVIALLFLALGTISFNWNAFGIANPNIFASFQKESEQLVLDGLLQGQDKTTKMGYYSRPTAPAPTSDAPKFYEVKDRRGSFVPYFSQYGLQFNFFHFLYENVSEDYRIYQLIVSISTAICLSLFYFGINIRFGRWEAVAFSLSILLSPWITYFGRNIYWVPISWFAPAIVTIFAGRMIFESTPRIATFISLLFLAFLCRFLCGYEYMSTIGVSVAPFLILYAADLKDRRIKRLVLAGALVLASFLLAFGSAIVAHALQVGNGSLNAGFSRIEDVAGKRVSASLCDGACILKSCRGDAECAWKIQDSLQRSAVSVAGRYVIMGHLIPWIDSFSNLNDKISDFQSIFRSKSVVEFANASNISIISRILSAILFAILFVSALVVSYRSSFWVMSAFAISFAGPMSWFILAKGHSAIHTHLNYVLWYLIAIPFWSFLLTHFFRSGRRTRRLNDPF